VDNTLTGCFYPTAPTPGTVIDVHVPQFQYFYRVVFFLQDHTQFFQEPVKRLVFPIRVTIQDYNFHHFYSFGNYTTIAGFFNSKKGALFYLSFAFGDQGGGAQPPAKAFD
jgi:hypothetical protein